MSKKFLKVWDAFGGKKAVAVNDDVNSLIEAGCSKLQMTSETVKAFLEDGTEIDDHDVLMCLEPGTVIYLLHQNDKKPWSTDDRKTEPVFEDGESSSSSFNSPTIEHSDSPVNNNLKALQWPKEFEIPSSNFSSDLKHSLENEKFLQWPEKCELLNHLGRKIQMYTDNPSSSQRKQVSIALISKYPHLKSHIGEGWYVWSNRIYDKMRELRRRKGSGSAVCRPKKLKSNAFEKSDDSPKAVKVKMRHRGEINWAPDAPDGEDSISLNAHKEQLIKEFRKETTSRDEQWIKEKMDLCFSARRTLINENETIQTLKSEYPFLFQYEALVHEFHLLMAINIEETFFSELNDIAPILFDIARESKKPDIYKTIQNFELQPLDEKVKNHLITVLLFVPLMLAEKTEVLYKIYEPETPIEVIKCGPTTPHVSIVGNAYDSHLVFIVGENDIIVEVDGFIEGIICLIAVYYCFNIKFPPDGKCTYGFIESQLLKLQQSTACPRRLGTLCEKIAKAKSANQG